MKILFLLVFSLPHFLWAGPKMSVYDFQLKSIDGKETSLGAFKGKPILLVNVASKCGYTKQYAGLENTYKKFKDKGLVIVGIPANNFGAQEPGTNAEIKSFCSLNYGVSFPMMEKISVKGNDKHPLYSFLTENAPEKGEVGWNFEKFLIGKDGSIIGRFKSGVDPESKELIGSIEKAL